MELYAEVDADVSSEPLRLQLPIVKHYLSDLKSKGSGLTTRSDSGHLHGGTQVSCTPFADCLL